MVYDVRRTTYSVHGNLHWRYSGRRCGSRVLPGVGLQRPQPVAPTRKTHVASSLGTVARRFSACYRIARIGRTRPTLGGGRLWPPRKTSGSASGEPATEQTKAVVRVHVVGQIGCTRTTYGVLVQRLLLCAFQKPSGMCLGVGMTHDAESAETSTLSTQVAYGSLTACCVYTLAVLNDLGGSFLSSSHGGRVPLRSTRRRWCVDKGTTFGVF